MSHITAMAVEITDIKALGVAAKELGGNLVRKDTYNWFGRSVGDYPLPAGMTVEMLGQCEYAIQVPGVHYEVGVVKLANGKYTLACDFYGYDGNDMHDGHKLLRQFGTEGDGAKGVHKLAQAYSVTKLTMEAKKRGYLMTRQQGKNGDIRLVVTGM